MLVKILQAHLDAVGAKDESEFAARFSAYVAEVTKNKTSMSETNSTIEALATEVANLKSELAEVKAFLPKEKTFAEAFNVAIDSEPIKKKVGAEASRIASDAISAAGIVPVKPAPAAAASGDDSVKGMIEAGEYEKAFSASKDLQAEFPSAKHFATYAKAAADGRVKFSNSKK